MGVPIRLFWQGLVGAAILARDSKFVVVALPQPGATQGLFCLESFHLMHLERLSELSGRYPSDDTLVALSVTPLEGCIPIPRTVAVSCPAKRPIHSGAQGGPASRLAELATSSEHKNCHFLC